MKQKLKIQKPFGINEFDVAIKNINQQAQKFSSMEHILGDKLLEQIKLKYEKQTSTNNTN